MAMISLHEAKTYLRVDSDDEDELIRRLSDSAQKLCMSVLRSLLFGVRRECF